MIERIFIIPGLGIQLETAYGSGTRIEKELITKDSIKSVLIMEGAHRLQFIFYLALYTAQIESSGGRLDADGEEEGERLIVLFPNVLPKLEDLKHIREGIITTLELT